MSKRAIKSGWHLLMAAAAFYEYTTTRSNLRRLMCGATAGWHLAAARLDWVDVEKGDEECLKSID